MAKQSGIHQLRGKVGEHSYYRQTGIQSGLVRSINQGMSSRVKTDEAFANTRLNNSEFGQAGRIASALGQYIVPKFRPMILPFSQSKMAKRILEYIKNDTTADWGKRNLTSSNSRDAQIDALNSVVKNRFGDFGLNLTIDEETGKLKFEVTAQTLSKMDSIEATGLDIRFLTVNTWVGKFQPLFNRYAMTTAHSISYSASVEDLVLGETLDIDYLIFPSPSEGAPQFGTDRMGIVILMPYRVLNDKQYILQEHCTFKAFAIVDGAVS